MSETDPPIATPSRAAVRDPVRQATAISGVAMLAGLGVSLSDAHATTAIGLSLAGVVVALFVLAPSAASLARRHPSVVVVMALPLIGMAWLAFGLSPLRTEAGAWLPQVASLRGAVTYAVGVKLLPLLAMAVAAVGGFILIADALRATLGLGSRRDTPWHQLTAGSAQPSHPVRAVSWEAILGVLLVMWAAFLGLGLARPVVANDPVLQIVLLMIVVGAAAVMIGTPLLIAALTRADRERATTTRNDERQRFAAHLHDSVLQTLALVQRQAHDPAAVTKLARRQEHALRSWMAGETELSSDTLGATLREVIAEIEDEHSITVEHSLLGDRPLDAAGTALAAAAREALRNSARHAAGARVFVFGQIESKGAQIFVRDEGPGFLMEEVPNERRGIRDAIIGRMSAVGGRATIESAVGEGTEVALAWGRTDP